LRTQITEALCHGHRVQLDGLGTLSMELSSHVGTRSLQVRTCVSVVYASVPTNICSTASPM
jgi:nucleoid DNA-binding protein